MKTCLSCGEALRDDARFCANCGSTSPSAESRQHTLQAGVGETTSPFWGSSPATDEPPAATPEIEPGLQRPGRAKNAFSWVRGHPFPLTIVALVAALAFLLGNSLGRRAERAVAAEELDRLRGQLRAGAVLPTAAPFSATPSESPSGITTESAIGQPFVSGGITLVVNEAFRVPSLKYERAVNQHEVGEPVPPPPGGEFVVVKTTVTNNASEALDLTCSYDVATKLVDVAGKRYDAVDDLAWVLPNNPECNASLNPGFSSSMTWAYAVSQGTAIRGLSFQDVVDFSQREPEVFVAFTA